MGRLQNKILQKYYKNISTPRHVPYYRSTVFPTQIFRDLLDVSSMRQLTHTGRFRQ